MGTNLQIKEFISIIKCWILSLYHQLHLIIFLTILLLKKSNLLKKLSFSFCVFLVPLSKISWLYMHGLFFFFWALYSLMSALMSVAYCFDYWRFIIYSKITNCGASNFPLHSQNHFGYSGYFGSLMDFEMAFFLFL